MIQIDALIDRDLTDYQIRSAFATILSLEPQEVEIVPDLLLVDPQAERGVLCVRTTTRGDFPLYLSVFVKSGHGTSSEVLPLMRQFCMLLKCACLIPDRSMNPYSRLLVDEFGVDHHVFLDSSKMDSDPEEYALQPQSTSSEQSA